MMPALCRNCFLTCETDQVVCPNCNSPRLVKHTNLYHLCIAHIDCDAFYTAIEKRDNPTLKGRPVIVGGGKRGVVATACYIARLYGVRSAMPMFKALKICPEAIVIPPNFDKYRTAANIIRGKIEAITPVIQNASIDETYMDLSGTWRLHGRSPAGILAKLQSDIEKDVGVTTSVGLSYNKFLAKMASEIDKPCGFAIIGQNEAKSWLADKPIRSIHGVGSRLAAKLMYNGLHKINDIQRLDAKQLIKDYGEIGLWLLQRANGVDERKIQASALRKSISSETTFETDLSDVHLLSDPLWLLSIKIADLAKQAELDASTITLKLKTANFKTLTRSLSINRPTQLAHRIFEIARKLLVKECDGRSFRLIGIGLSNFSPAGVDIPDLLDYKTTKRNAAERAADLARDKFGKNTVMTGRTARIKVRTR